ncbi:MAG: amino acid ABC transporter permease [Anaerolineaceae bacterium]|jgi:polar amino acid transport system permease protein|nr:amino acid ABC transporter permease [Anaerolineaceae bacterium]
MALQNPATATSKVALKELTKQRLRTRLASFPWWLAAIGLIIATTLYLIAKSPSFNEAFSTIRAGIGVTLTITLISYSISLIIGLVTGLGRVSKNIGSQNIATFYVETMRGIPMLVSIFFIALVLVPGAVDLVGQLGTKLSGLGLTGIGNMLAAANNRAVSMSLRAIIALSITYGAYSAEIFRAGFQSVPVGQMEAARSQGLSHGQAMRHVILPQAIRNVLPAIGNDFIAMLKDSSLVSVLAVRDVTQIARLYAGHSFRFPEAYTTLSVMYLTMTLMLSMVVKLIEKRISPNGQ